MHDAPPQRRAEEGYRSRDRYLERTFRMDVHLEWMLIVRRRRELFICPQPLLDPPFTNRHTPTRLLANHP